jgi:putative addiction module CopG family antidote
MDVTVPKYLEALVRRKVDEGHYTIEDEVVADALRLMQARDAAAEIMRARLKEAIERGYQDVAAAQEIRLESDDEIDAFFLCRPVTRREQPEYLLVAVGSRSRLSTGPALVTDQAALSASRDRYPNRNRRRRHGDVDDISQEANNGSPRRDFRPEGNRACTRIGTGIRCCSFAHVHAAGRSDGPERPGSHSAWPPARRDGTRRHPTALGRSAIGGARYRDRPGGRATAGGSERVRSIGPVWLEQNQPPAAAPVPSRARATNAASDELQPRRFARPTRA